MFICIILIPNFKYLGIEHNFVKIKTNYIPRNKFIFHLFLIIFFIKKNEYIYIYI